MLRVDIEPVVAEVSNLLQRNLSRILSDVVKDQNKNAADIMALNDLPLVKRLRAENASLRARISFLESSLSLFKSGAVGNARLGGAQVPSMQLPGGA